MGERDLAEEEIDKEWQASEISLETQSRNGSSKLHPLCSASQTKLSGYAWLIGRPHGAIKPLMCIAPVQSNCTLSSIASNDDTIMGVFDWILIVFQCLFVLANLISMAVWFRRKAPIQWNREVRIQLLLLRLFSVLGFVFSLSVVGVIWSIGHPSFRVISVLHAALLVYLENFIFGLVPTCSLFLPVLSFITAIFLIEHSQPSRTVLLFSSFTVAKVLILVALLVCIVIESPVFLLHGFVYCESSAGATLLLNEMFLRVPWKFLRVIRITSEFMSLLASILVIILLFVFACLRYCNSCQSQPFEQSASVSAVAYSRHVDDLDEVGDDEQTENVVIDSLPSVPNAVRVADELRLILLWHQILFGAGFVLVVFTLVVVHVVAILHGMVFSKLVSGLFHLIGQCLFFSSLVILSPLMSATIRDDIVSVLVAIKRLLQSFICCRWVPARRGDGLSLLK
ncbi:hypothetical protein BOX15_Mlig026934g1 [Macrostomum lignano]|uniref:Uncharacterized protein n=1 Tax=Macrostomum lignano TaxID=282301 RepID=A0A267GMS4_9PLAT|nr:hypothetical protein BOX15_Mlig026934g1 [Macrostomum lignano]